MLNESPASLTPTVGSICDQIGRKEIAAALKVRPSAVSNAVADNCFPSKWYLVVKSLCDAAQVECPDRLFAFSKLAPVAQSQEDAA